jgi:hypothetical protein
MKPTLYLIILLSSLSLSYGIELKTNAVYENSSKDAYLLGWNFDSGFFARVLNIKDMSFVMLDAYGKVYGPFVSNTQTAISPDCSKFAYTVAGKGGTQVYFGDKLFAEHETVTHLEIMPDSSAPVFIFSKNGKDYLYYKGMSIGGYRQISEYEIAGDTRSCGLIYRVNRSYYLHTGFTNTGPYKECKKLKLSYNGASSIAIAKSSVLSNYPAASKDSETSISADGSMKGVCYLKNCLYIVGINDFEYGPYEFASAPVFGDKPGEYAFCYVNGGQSFIRSGEQIYGPWDFAYNFAFLTEYPYFVFVIQSGGDYYIRLGENETLGPYSYADTRIAGGKLHILSCAGGTFYFCEMK